MKALEAEQARLDNRAGVVEKKLRQLIETGKVLNGCKQTFTGKKLWSLREMFTDISRHLIVVGESESSSDPWS